MNGHSKLIGIAVVAATVAAASFQSDVAIAFGVVALAVAGFSAVAILVGAAVATRHTGPAIENGRAPIMDATPALSSLQEQ